MEQHHWITRACPAGLPLAWTPSTSQEHKRARTTLTQGNTKEEKPWDLCKHILSQDFIPIQLLYKVIPYRTFFGILNCGDTCGHACHLSLAELAIVPSVPPIFLLLCFARPTN